MKVITVLAFLFLSYSSKAQNSIWEINEMKVHDSTQLQDYISFLKKIYGGTRDEGIKQGMLVSYKILPRIYSQHMKTDYDILLMTEYKNQEQVDLFSKEYSRILEKLYPSKEDRKYKGKSWQDFGQSVRFMVVTETQ